MALDAASNETKGHDKTHTNVDLCMDWRFVLEIHNDQKLCRL